MKAITKALLFSMITLCICTALTVGGTLALFSDRAEVNNHLSAGSLDVGLNRIAYTENALNAQGIMAKSTNNTRLDLTKSANQMFSIEKAVPTSSYEATVEVSNLGSVAFDYGMRILWKPNSDTKDNDEVLANQLQITVTSSKIANSTHSISFKLSECEEHDIQLGYLLKGTGVDTFTVKAEFINDNAVNNLAMSANLEFDVQVYATQKTA